MDETTLRFLYNVTSAEVTYWEAAAKAVKGPDLDTGWLRRYITEQQTGAARARLAMIREHLSEG